MSVIERIGENIRKLRVLKGYTQNELALLAFDNEELKHRIATIEQGRNTNLESVEAIAEALDVEFWKLAHPGFKLTVQIEVDADA